MFCLEENSVDQMINTIDLQDKWEFNTIKIFEENEILKRLVNDLGIVHSLNKIYNKHIENNVIKNKELIIDQLEKEVESKDQTILKLRDEAMITNSIS